MCSFRCSGYCLTVYKSLTGIGYAKYRKPKGFSSSQAKENSGLNKSFLFRCNPRNRGLKAAVRRLPNSLDFKIRERTAKKTDSKSLHYVRSKHFRRNSTKSGLIRDYRRFVGPGTRTRFAPRKFCDLIPARYEPFSAKDALSLTSPMQQCFGTKLLSPASPCCKPCGSQDARNSAAMRFPLSLPRPQKNSRIRRQS